MQIMSQKQKFMLWAPNLVLTYMTEYLSFYLALDLWSLLF